MKVKIEVELDTEREEDMKAFEVLASAIEGIDASKVMEKTKTEETKETSRKTRTRKVVAEQPAENQIPATPSVPTPVSVIPTTQVVTEYTQEQIARAMTNALDMGKQDLVFNKILAKFNARSLMDIDKANYGTIASILTEAGVSV